MEAKNQGLADAVRQKRLYLVELLVAYGAENIASFPTGSLTVSLLTPVSTRFSEKARPPCGVRCG